MGEWVLARPERLYPIPPGVPEERAVFAEPLAVVLRGLNKLKPWPEEVLVLGMGTIGLLAVRLLRALGYAGRLLAVAKYPHQAERAKAFGADGVYGSAKEALWRGPGATATSSLRAIGAGTRRWWRPREAAGASGRPSPSPGKGEGAPPGSAGA